MLPQEPLSNCGIIFLYPFLPIFFKEHELLLVKEFKNKDSKIKAIQLLHYLATSKVDFLEETDLDFFKFLVGFPQEDLINFPEKLNKSEINSCLILLQSFLKNWSPMKNVSIESVQHHFIQKKGMISEKETTIEIILAEDPVDLLLDRLPYNYGMIGLPWLKKIMMVDV